MNTVCIMIPGTNKQCMDFFSPFLYSITTIILVYITVYIAMHFKMHVSFSKNKSIITAIAYSYFKYKYSVTARVVCTEC